LSILIDKQFPIPLELILDVDVCVWNVRHIVQSTVPY
jgi:hypothetical protein